MNEWAGVEGRLPEEIEKLIGRLKECSTYGFKQEICGEAAIALSALQADLEQVKQELQAYKDTGLSPEEVNAVAGLASENCAKTADAIDRLLQSDAVDAPRFAPGQVVWIVERNKYDAACGVRRCIFLAEVAGYAILSPYVNDCDELKYLLDYHRRETYVDYDADIPVVFVDDCYASQEAAHEALNAETGGEPDA